MEQAGVEILEQKIEGTRFQRDARLNQNFFYLPKEAT